MLAADSKIECLSDIESQGGGNRTGKDFLRRFGDFVRNVLPKLGRVTVKS